MTTSLRRKRDHLIREALAVIRELRAVNHALREERARYELMHVRTVRNLVEQFLIVHESGIDVRDELLDGLRDLSDHQARLEEYV